MRALVMHGHGDVSQLEVSDVPPPTVQRAGDVLVRLHAAALNHLDLWTLRGLPGLSQQFPHTLGGDGAGTVEDAGDAVSRVRNGDRIMLNPGVACYRCEYCEAGAHPLCPSYRLLGEHLPGTLAEYIVVPEQNVTPIPALPAGHEPLSWAEAAAYPLVTLTAWRMLVKRAKVRSGETVLIWGIGGGVAIAALKIAKLVGARVIVTSSSDAKLAAAKELGADATLNHASEDVTAEVRRLTDRRGVDVVVENVGAATWDASLRLLGRGGRLVTCGATTGATTTIDVLGSTMGSLQDFREIVSVLAQGQLRPTVDTTFPLRDGVLAIERLAAGAQFGKVVVEIE
jgi:NADPH:quinone reductase-like Zn-dependent oxidoreductase